MAEKYLNLDNVKGYKISSGLSDYVWNIVNKWDWFNKRSLGVQWLNATDSIAGNIAEAFGRHHKKDKQKFFYNARGSAYESAHWAKKAYERKLITKKDFDYILQELRRLPKEINFLIKITGDKLKE